MVYLNKVISINIKSLENIILEKLENAIQDELFYVDNINEDKKENIKNNILKEIKNQIKTDYFIYRIMDEKKCVFKHSRGKNEGYFCHKNITKNGNHKEYLCRIHNKYHVPIKKNIKNVDNYKVSDISVNESIEKTNVNNKIMLYNSSAINKQRIILKNKNKYYIKGLNPNIKNIIKNYSSDTICKYNKDKLCHNIDKYGKCDFKNVHNNFSIQDYINNEFYSIDSKCKTCKIVYNKERRQFKNEQLKKYESQIENLYNLYKIKDKLIDIYENRIN